MFNLLIIDQGKTMKLNKEWHLAHPMPKNPTMEQRMAWHIEHSKHCQCREIPERLKAEIKKYQTEKK